MKKAEWDAYVARTLEGITDAAAKRRKREMFKTADERYQTFEENVQMTMEDMERDFTSATESLIGTSNVGDHFQHDALRLRASNRLYEQTLQQVKDLRLQMAALKAQMASGGATATLGARYGALAKQIASKISEGLTYANEVYSTEGSTLHVVVGMQIASKKTQALKEKAEAENAKRKQRGEPELPLDTRAVTADLRPEHFVQSFDEQVGDSLKDLTHYEDQPPYAAYRAGKYIDRMLIAAKTLVPTITTDADYVALRALGNAHLGAKRSGRTKSETDAKVRAAAPTVGDDPTLVASHDAFKDYTTESLASLRSQVLTFATTVTTAYENAKSAANAPSGGATPTTSGTAPVTTTAPSTAAPSATPASTATTTTPSATLAPTSTTAPSGRSSAALASTTEQEPDPSAAQANALVQQANAKADRLDALLSS